MLSIELWCVGGLKEPFWKEACAEYIKRLGSSARVSVREFKEHPLAPKASAAEEAAALEAEGQAILARLPKDALVAALCIEGREMTSEAFSEWLGKRMTGGCSHICFLIGGSHGLAQTVKARADERISFSRMTMPHMLARVFLLEQLYRAMNLLSGGHYHK